MNLDTLVSAGYQPWMPTVGATDVDVWDKYDFPTCGTYRLGDDLVIFTLITTAGRGSLWAYVPVPPAEREMVTGARFDTENEFEAFLDGRFADREAVFAAAENFVITWKSDGVYIPSDRHALLRAASEWYVIRSAATHGRPPQRMATNADADTLLRTAQGALAGKSA
jgi:hypothetical protein